MPWTNGAYAAGSPRSGTVAGLRATLTAPANWNGHNTARVSWLTTPLQVLATLLPAPPAGADSLTQKLYSIFAHLDMSQVPTSYFYEASTEQPVAVRLFDAQGTLRAEGQSTGAPQVRLATASLPEGLYYVHLVRGSEVLSRQQLRIEY